MQLSGSNPLDGLRAFLFLGRPGYGFVLSKIIRRNPAPAQQMMCLVAILAGLAPSREDRTLRKEGTGREEGKRYDRKTAAARREPGRSMRGPASPGHVEPFHWEAVLGRGKRIHRSQSLPQRADTTLPSAWRSHFRFAVLRCCV